MLLGERTRLRDWRPDDAAAVHAACQDPGIQRFTPVSRPYRWSDAEHFLEHRVGEIAAAGGAAFAVEARAHPGVVVASASLLFARPEASGDGDVVGELGYWCAPEARGRGYVGDAVTVLTDWAFAERGVTRLEMVIETANHTSRAVAARAGFEEDRPAVGEQLRGSTRETMVHVRRRDGPGPGR